MKMVEIYLLNEEKKYFKEYIKIYKSGRIRIYDEFYDKEQEVFLLNTAFGLTQEGSIKLKKILRK